MITSIACTIPRPTGGILAAFEEEDDQRGYEPEARLQVYLDRLVREAETRIAAGRPRRTVGLASGRLVAGADQGCICGQTDGCRCKDPRPAGRLCVTVHTAMAASLLCAPDGDSDPNMGEALRRVRVGGGR
ncbi:hypothetical protein [Streptomyces hygroscopicus]|uniref:hypothetical protein n=1 Tax=Streptomyces hygroscopicus TaxID=1912 RepID=UPI0007828526|nr:hypothetical protein [Streptomyces hygroscopicus]